MSGEILVGEGREIRRVGDEAFVKAMSRVPERMEERLRFMTREHHAVRDFVVRELPRQNGITTVEPADEGNSPARPVYDRQVPALQNAREVKSQTRGRDAHATQRGRSQKPNTPAGRQRYRSRPATAGRLRMTSPSGSAEEKLLTAAAAACRPISARQIAGVTGLDEWRVKEILAELEKHLFFLVRNAEGEVSWAFPVTVEKTEHRLAFSSGEKIFGA